MFASDLCLDNVTANISRRVSFGPDGWSEVKSNINKDGNRHISGKRIDLVAVWDSTFLKLEDILALLFL